MMKDTKVVIGILVTVAGDDLATKTDITISWF